MFPIVQFLEQAISRHGRAIALALKVIAILFLIQAGWGRGSNLPAVLLILAVTSSLLILVELAHDRSESMRSRFHHSKRQLKAANHELRIDKGRLREIAKALLNAKLKIDQVNLDAQRHTNEFSATREEIRSSLAVAQLRLHESIGIHSAEAKTAFDAALSECRQRAALAQIIQPRCKGIRFPQEQFNSEAQLACAEFSKEIENIVRQYRMLPSEIDVDNFR